MELLPEDATLDPNTSSRRKGSADSAKRSKRPEPQERRVQMRSLVGLASKWADRLGDGNQGLTD